LSKIFRNKIELVDRGLHHNSACSKLFYGFSAS
jgi:hypothetical protein